MKPTATAKSALALALGLVASMATAGVVSTNAVFADFAGIADNTTVQTGFSASNLTWSVKNSGTADASKVESEILKIDTGDDTIQAVIESGAATGINDALNNSTFKSITFSADVAFTPTDEVESFAADDELKFALYALINPAGTQTNLLVHALAADGNSTNTTASNIVLDDRLTTVTVNITNESDVLYFTVTANGATTPRYRTLNSALNNNISALNLQGQGQIDNIAFSYNVKTGYSAGDVPAPGGTGAETVTLSEKGANYLNALVDGSSESAVLTALGNMSASELTDAMLLNLDITQSGVAEDVAGAYTFNITSVKRTASGVTVTVTLDRGTSKLGQVIRGAAALYTSSNAVDYVKDSSHEFADSDFSEGNTTTITFPATSATFFKVKIEGDSAIQ